MHWCDKSKCSRVGSRMALYRVLMLFLLRSKCVNDGRVLKTSLCMSPIKQFWSTRLVTFGMKGKAVQGNAAAKCPKLWRLFPERLRRCRLLWNIKLNTYGDIHNPLEPNPRLLIGELECISETLTCEKANIWKRWELLYKSMCSSWWRGLKAVNPIDFKLH